MKVYFAEVMGIETPAEWMASMSPEKRARIKKMRSRESAQAAVTAHRLLCYVLKKTYGITPEPDDWETGRYGKPYLKNRNIHFNISHSGNMAMCALGDSPVGADVELIRPFSDDVAKRIMSAEERRAFLSAEDKDMLFFKIWTLKEAYLKYTGVGISGLSGITVYPLGGEIKTNAGCTFTLIDGMPGYQAAVCAKEGGVSVENVQNDVLYGVPGKP